MESWTVKNISDMVGRRGGGQISFCVDVKLMKFKHLNCSFTSSYVSPLICSSQLAAFSEKAGDLGEMKVVYLSLV